VTTEENVTVTIQGDKYTFQGVTDLEVIALAKVFGTERPKEGTKEYAKWQQQFIDNFNDLPVKRDVAIFLRCAFPDIPERIVKYTVRRLPDGTEECRPGIDLRVRISAKEFEQIILLISSELQKMEQKLNQERNSQTITLDMGTHDVKSIMDAPDISPAPAAIKRKKPEHFVLDEIDDDQADSNSARHYSSEEVVSIVTKALKFVR